MVHRSWRQCSIVVVVLAMAGCATFPGASRAVKSYPHPAKETVAAVNQALRDLNFYPTDLLPSHSNPRLTYVSTAYREQSLGEIVYVAVRAMGAEQSQVEVLTRGDLSGAWTWSTWWPPLVFEQTTRRLRATPTKPQSAPIPATPLPDRLAL
ncbi:hypothetical protein MELA_02034 [Candidatus Methylomirabilis lanthanidiphila]|uniref:Lipoprotein n=1 Tax=Candidatus Methylomirabilis lanthanidiphila TaxID=2211376 RepID=A0A564ZJY0_9BACT|nr:hypothetical protein MELA_02034 [Candidatus Methylomirabilis lanthanidiphila]